MTKIKATAAITPIAYMYGFKTAKRHKIYKKNPEFTNIKLCQFGIPTSIMNIWPFEMFLLNVFMMISGDETSYYSVIKK